MLTIGEAPNASKRTWPHSLAILSWLCPLEVPGNAAVGGLATLLIGHGVWVCDTPPMPVPRVSTVHHAANACWS